MNVTEDDTWGVERNMSERRQTRRDSSRSSRKKSFIQVDLERGDQLPDEYTCSQMTILEMPTVVRAPEHCCGNTRCLAFAVILLLVFAAIW